MWTAKGYAGLIALAACGRTGFESPRVDSSVSDSPKADAAIDDAPMLQGLVAWWKLDEGSGTEAHDTEGTTDGIFNGSGLTWLPTGGELGGALDFAGGSGTVSFGTAPALANLPELTISLWLKPTSATHDGPIHCFFDHGNSITPVGGWYADVAELADGDISFGVFYGSTDLLRRVSRPNVIAPGTWSHVVITWDGTSLATGVHLYVGGSEVTYAETLDPTSQTRLDDSPIPAGLGCIATTHYVGAEDDVKVFDRALSATEVAGL